jgi:hypothetical protein
VSAHFTFSLNSGGHKVSLKATFVGTIASFGPVGGKTLVHITPTGGSLVLTEKLPGHPASKATAIPNGSDVLLALNTGTNTFFSMAATDIFKPGSPGGLSNQPVVIAIAL